ncbi:MAG: hypothetical protein KTU85_10085 [Acidimicrobiia bacterium]|nr:hypothetical protein [Acidimicrobiia bacterium]
MSLWFFVDENDLGLGRRLSQKQKQVLFPGHPSIPDVPRGCQDEVWLKVVGQQELVVITRDRRIRYRPVERRVWIEHRVRGFVLTGRASQTTGQSLDILANHWKRIESTVQERTQGPWMYAITDSGLREVPFQ